MRGLARAVLVLGAAMAAVAGCNAISGAGDLAADLPDESDDDASTVTPPPPEAPPLTCGKGTKRCGDECVDASDPAFGCGGSSCDRCSVPFAASVKCDDGGRCAPNACNSGHADCNGDPTDGCEADLTLTETCGACNVKCASGMFCAFGQGGCVVSCPGSTTACGSSCIDVSSSPAHCGSCTNACPTPRTRSRRARRRNAGSRATQASPTAT